MLRMFTGLALMAVSNAAAWYLVKMESGSSVSTLRSSVWKIALFYTLWALYNRYPGGREGELGHFSFGLLVASCLATQFLCGPDIPEKATRIPLMLSCGLVTLNFSVVLPMILSMGGPKAFAEMVWAGEPASGLLLVWTYTFLLYIASNMVLWLFCCYLFYKLPLFPQTNIASSMEYTTPTIEQTEYQPVENVDC